MALQPRDRTYAATAATAVGADVDAGLRTYMLRVYNYMALGVALTGILAMVVAMNPALMQTVAIGPMKWALFAGILGLGWFSPRLMLNGSTTAAHVCFWVYAAMWGALIAPMFYIYTGESIVRVFFITSAAFAGTSLYGYTTKRDLTTMGRFLMMASIGILVAIVVNIFMQSAAFHYFLAIVVVLVFAGLTAYETQAIKDSYLAGDHADTATKKAVFGAFLLYGSFITMFIWLLTIFGSRD
tara:strand:- start:3 stop:725 length:723 start_codon:yes stop_codon:yes gene_type:complete